jgi:hypothetical protein
MITALIFSFCVWWLFFTANCVIMGASSSDNLLTLAFHELWNDFVGPAVQGLFHAFVFHLFIPGVAFMIWMVIIS